MPASGSLIEVIVSLALVYLLAGSLCAAFLEICRTILSSRHNAQARTVRSLCGSQEDPAVTNNLAGRILDHPAIRTLPPYANTDSIRLPAGVFAGALIDELSVLARTSGTARPRVADLIAAAPSGDLRRTLGLFAEESGFDRRRFQARIEEWYQSAMDRAAGWRRRRGQVWLLACATVLALLLNIDSMDIARTVWAGASAMPIGWEMPTGSDFWSAVPVAASSVLERPTKLLGIFASALGMTAWGQLLLTGFRRLNSVRSRDGGRRFHEPATIGVSAATFAPVERAESDLEASGLTRDDIEDIQRALGMSGRFLTGRLDPATRSMIEEFQLSVGRRPTGVLTPYLLERILAADR